MLFSRPSEIREFYNYGKSVFIVLFLFVAHHGSSQSFTNVSTGIPVLTNARSEWVDFNNDNRPDLFISGVNGSGGLHTAVYLNNGDNTFNSVNLTALTDIAYDFGDYNSDGFIDIIVSGINVSNEKKTILYRNNSGTAFVAQAMGLMNLSKGGILWKDIDSDTDLDLILTGLDASNEEHTLVYVYDNGQYSSVSHPMPNVSNGQLLAADANNDDQVEILITGLNSSGLPVSMLFTWFTNGTSAVYSDDLPGTAFNSVTHADYNSDGFTDIFISGLANEALDKQSFILENNGVNDFVSVSSIFKDVSSASVDAGDLNNDGFTDIVLSGIDDGGFKYFKYYQNSIAFAFSDVLHNMQDFIYNGDAALTDYENDGDLDIFQIGNSGDDDGFQANLYLSDQAATVVNAPPSIPSGLESTVLEDSIYLTWTPSTDDLANAASITYNLYISREEDGEDLVVSPLSDIATGYRKSTGSGNAGHKTFKSFRGLPEGRYYWSVQAIDNANKGSAFAVEGTFAVCYSISLGPDTTICHKDILELSIGGSNDEVDWYSKTAGLLLDDSNDLSHIIDDNDTIVVALTRPYNCTVKDTLIVTMSLPPVIDLGADTAICSGELFELDMALTVDSVNWYNPNGELLLNSHEYGYAVNAKDTIIAHVFNEYKCLSIDSIVVDVLALPDFSAGSDREVCFKENTLLEVTGTWPTVNWHSTKNGELAMGADTYSYLIVETDTAIAEVIDDNGCINYDSAVIEMLPLPVISLGSDVSICYLEHVDLQLTGTGASVTWLDTDQNLLASDVANYSYQVLEKDTTIVKVVDDYSCVSYDSIIVHVLPLPQFSIGADTSICFDEDILLEAGAGFDRVDWYSKNSGDLINPDSWFFNYHVSVTDTLIAKVLHPNSCINYDSIRIEMLPLPDISLGADREICFGEQVAFHIDGSWDEVNWYTENDLILQPDDPSYQFVVDQSIPLWVEVFDSYRCVSYDTVQVNVLSLPQFDLGETLNYCDGDSISLSVENIGETYSWTDPEGAELSNSQEYNYVARDSELIRLTVVDDFHCTFIDSVFVAVHALPDVSVIGTPVICENDTVTLGIDYPNSTVEWFNADTDVTLAQGSVLQMAFSESMEIGISLTDINNCLSTETITLTVHERPVANAGEDQLLCYDEVSVIGGESDPGNDHQWVPSDFLDDPSKANPVITGTATRKYAITVTNAHNCSSVDSVYVEVNPEIVVDAGASTSICIGDSIRLGGNPTASGSNFDYSYQWVAGDHSIEGNLANPVVSPQATTLFYILVSSGKCEVEYDSIEVVVNPLPVVTIISDQSIGAGSSVMLNAGGGVEYEWSPSESLDDAGSATPVASPLKSTKYHLKVTDANHCQDTASVHVFVQNKLFIPNTFSPNGDDKNDVFKLYGSGVAEVVFSVFDQKGNRVFHSTDHGQLFETGWDGKLNGNVLKDDIYFWTIDGMFYNGEPVRFEGKNNGIIKLMK
jgi:gliding motility-associated-like protein